MKWQVLSRADGSAGGDLGVDVCALCVSVGLRLLQVLHIIRTNQSS